MLELTGSIDIIIARYHLYVVYSYQDVVFETANRRRRRDLDTARVANLIRRVSDVCSRVRAEGRQEFPREECY